MTVAAGRTTPRALWALFEPIHAVTYFAPQARAAFEAAGFRGFWRGYFAGRAAPLGRVPAPVVTSLFYGFAPPMVARAVPSVWELAPPADALAAREAGAVAALSALPDGKPEGPWLAEAVELARAAVDAADLGGRALGAAGAALPWPGDPVAALWHGATVLRELRGDGHVAALLTAGLSGLDALVLRAAADLDRTVLQLARGWTDAQWDAAADDLITRGLLERGQDGAVSVTDTGRGLLDDVEAVTDHLAAGPWQALGAAATARFAALIEPVGRAAAATLPALTPIGLPGRPE